jgi:SulP family sulfate permease
MLVALPSAIAFGVLAYTAIGPGYAGQGAMAGAVGAACLGIVASLVGRTNVLISAPCAPAAAVLTALVIGLPRAGTTIPSHAIPALITLTVVLSSALQVLYGVIRGGRLIKFIPYPVVSGYLSGVAVLIAIGQIPKLFGLPKGMAVVQGLLRPHVWGWQGLIVGIVTMTIMLTAPRLTRKVPAGIIGLLGGVATYFALALISPQMLDLQKNPLIIGPISASASVLDMAFSSVKSLLMTDYHSIELILGPALTLSVLLSIDTLKTCVVLDTLTRSRHNSDRQLIGQGLGNLTSCLAGGMPGAGSMGPTLVNWNSGGRTFRSGAIEAVFVVLALIILDPLIAWIPIAALAGLMMVIAFRMFDWSVFRLLRYPAGRLDFTVIAIVVLVAATVDLITASAVGVACAILLFIRGQVRSSVIRRRLYLNQISSKTRRLAAEWEALKQKGDQAVFCELQGDLFFGTTDQLFTLLQADLRAKRFFLFDMRRVESCDYTAAHMFEQMQAQLRERGGQVLFSGMPSAQQDRLDIQHYLSQLGIVEAEGGVIVSETLDGALEWMENRILDDAGFGRKGDERPLDVHEFDLFAGLSENALHKLSGAMHTISIPEGGKVFAAGAPGDEVYLVRTGSVRILLPLEGGKYHHVATFGRGDFFGEVAFLDRGARSADAEAKENTELYVLSRDAFDRETGSSPEIGLQLFVQLAQAIADRLRQTDSELQVLEER